VIKKNKSYYLMDIFKKYVNKIKRKISENKKKKKKKGLIRPTDPLKSKGGQVEFATLEQTESSDSEEKIECEGLELEDCDNNTICLKTPNELTEKII